MATKSAPFNLDDIDWKPEPRWPAICASAAVTGLYYAMPMDLRLGPIWLLPLLVAGLMIPTVVSYRSGHHTWNKISAYAMLATLTLFTIYAIIRLELALVNHVKENPARILTASMALWTANILTFAVWYWRTDAGGPHERDMRAEHRCGAFLFPQMTMDPELLDAGDRKWVPGFVDYLFLAFNTSTALSPCDTAPLSRWAKFLMMVQASISLTIIVLVAARAVNIL